MLDLFQNQRRWDNVFSNMSLSLQENSVKWSYCPGPGAYVFNLRPRTSLPNECLGVFVYLVEICRPNYSTFLSILFIILHVPGAGTPLAEFLNRESLLILPNAYLVRYLLLSSTLYCPGPTC